MQANQNVPKSQKFKRIGAGPQSFNMQGNYSIFRQFPCTSLCGQAPCPPAGGADSSMPTTGKAPLGGFWLPNTPWLQQDTYLPVFPLKFPAYFPGNKTLRETSSWDIPGGNGDFCSCQAGMWLSTGLGEGWLQSHLPPVLQAWFSASAACSGSSLKRF